ncbi:MAG TPA: DUF1326 domain-containing protein [Thermoanaerobaculia bacterium]|nr:DUF1326 domain-containing protein [Thermoanaerobaculia bacterium]
MTHRAKQSVLAAIVAAALLGVALGAAAPSGAGQASGWAMNATAIEACSCPMFCQCYFNSKPAGHHESGAKEAHFCRANLAYRVNKGNFGSTSLDGAKFWLANDLGGDFSRGQMDWNVLYFDKSLSKEQRAGLQEIVGHLFPVKWNSFSTAEASIDAWQFDENGAHATMDGGKTAEVRLVRPAGSANGPGPLVLKNLKYWGAPRNDGFVMMPNEVEAYRVGPKAFEYKGTNGFLITVDLNSGDFPTAPAAKPAGK